MHRRKSSKDEDDLLSTTHENGDASTNGTPRIRVNSTPTVPAPQVIAKSSSYPQPPSAGPYQSTFSVPPPPRSPNNFNGATAPISSPFRTSVSAPLLPHPHNRHRSISSYTPASPSPLSTSFPRSISASSPSGDAPPSPFGSLPDIPSAPLSPVGGQHARRHSRNLSIGGPPPSPLGPGPDMQGPPSPVNARDSRRHSRIHSRNLSIFFPRPGSLPTNTIVEDGAQELEFPRPEDAPVATIPSTKRSPDTLRSFRFGGKGAAGDDGGEDDEGRAARRGHHHKHSLSHNFFSFLEPGGAAQELHTAPTPLPVSPWNPISPFPDAKGKASAASATSGSAFAQAQAQALPNAPAPPVPEMSVGGMVTAVAQFVLGAWVWVAGQQHGSLACTGLGYWVVFDAFGVALARVVPGYLASNKMKAEVRRPYGNARVETVLLFAQSVYLVFAAVYVCKETVEHLLLSAGEGEGHHHHSGDENAGAGIAFPSLLVFTALLSIIGTALGCDNHAKLVSTTGNRLPPPASYIRSLTPRSQYSSSSAHDDAEPTTLFERLSTNPYTVAPAVFSLAVLYAANFLAPHQHRPFDLLLAFAEAAGTFAVAYPAAVALGTVLLQTSPSRGQADGRMESFLRAMREVERHPQVLHLPAPHIWQLTPTKGLIVTLELHVRRDLDDADVLELSRWAWERCVGALRAGHREAEVTVGVVRG